MTKFFPFCDNIIGPYSGHRRDVRCLRNHCREAVKRMGYGYCQDGEEKVSSGFYPTLHVLSLPLSIIVYSFVSVSICIVL